MSETDYRNYRLSEQILFCSDQPVTIQEVSL